MAYATPTERLAVRKQIEDSGFIFDFTLLVKKDERESELVCDDLDHALELSGSWIKNLEAEYVEIFRVLPDGTLNPTIGPYIKETI